MRTEFTIANPFTECILKDRKLRKDFKGKIKCLPPDEFSEETGKKITELLAKIKREEFKYNQRHRRLNGIISQNLNIMDAIEGRMADYEKELEQLIYN